MTPREEALGRMGRSGLLEEIARLERDLAQAYENLTSVQTRCTELLEANRKLRVEKFHKWVLDEYAATFKKLADR